MRILRYLVICLALMLGCFANNFSQQDAENAYRNGKSFCDVHPEVNICSESVES